MNAEEKREAVKRLYSEVLLKGNREVAEELLLKDYRQHNPQAEDGRDGLLRHVADLNVDYPKRKISFLHLFVDGDYVITHIHFPFLRGRWKLLAWIFFGLKVIKLLNTGM